jgi:hypothetical protein
MPIFRSGPLLSLFVAGLLLAGCGGEGGSSGAAGSDASAGQRSGEPRISAEALGSIERENLTVYVPWTLGVVNRDASEGAGAATLLDVGVETVSGADRLLLTFDSAGGVPGDEDEGSIETAKECESGEPSQRQGDGFLHVRLQNTRLGEGVQAPTGVGDVLKNARAVRLACAQEGRLEWVVSVADASHYRAIEASDPARLAVDLRNAPLEQEGSEGR